ncbi:MAG TPA: methylenetetrahydrofolate reductase [Candidatus Edwardsbacteria bacterium]|nr:methylenetetrahydrofolate reductase [Candidatus Edwardsbacteria bacterium]
MHVTEHLNKRAKPLISLEITPPEKGHTIQGIYDTLDLLSPYTPSFVNVTYHQQSIVYEEQDNGAIRKVPKRKKPGTVGICAAIANRYRIETVPHLICGGFNRYETEDALIDLQYLGFENLFVIRGDPPPGYNEYVAEPDGYKYASELVRQIAALNRGEYLEKLDDAIPTNFCVGVGGYPEKHYEAPNLAEDIKNLKHKVDQGADYIISQMVFSASAFGNFVALARKEGINVPIIPGVKVITSERQLTAIPRDFHVNLPDALVSQIRGAADHTASRQAGITFAVKLCLDLLEQQVPCLHFYTMGKGGSVAEVLGTLKSKGLI